MLFLYMIVDLNLCWEYVSIDNCCIYIGIEWKLTFMPSFDASKLYFLETHGSKLAIWLKVRLWKRSLLSYTLSLNCKSV